MCCPGWHEPESPFAEETTVLIRRTFVRSATESITAGEHIFFIKTSGRLFQTRASTKQNNVLSNKKQHI